MTGRVEGQKLDPTLHLSVYAHGGVRLGWDRALCRSRVAGRFDAVVWALRPDLPGLTAADSNVRCGKALLNDGCDWAIHSSVVQHMEATLSGTGFWAGR